MATLADFGIPGVGNGILHPKMKHKYRVLFAGLGRLVPGTNSKDISAQVTTTTLPNISFQEVTLHRYNSIAYVAGKHEWQQINMTVEDDITGLASAAIKAQLETQQRIVGMDLPGQWLNTAATGSDYKFAVTIDQLDGNETVVSQWKLEGAFIITAEFGDRDYSSSDAATIQITLRYDHARHIDSGVGLGSALGGNAP